MKTVNILGATGSVGKSTADVILADPDNYAVRVVTANSNAGELAMMARQLKARHAVVADDAAYPKLKEALAGTDITCAAGWKALLEAASQPADWTMAAIVGMAGLEPIIESIRQGRQVAIANKEPLVAAGPVVLAEAEKSGAVLLPVDSEHNAIFQLMEENNKDRIQRLILTASGGPFLKSSWQEMKMATPQKALTHPTWTMGPKVSIDSATMMNKGFEVIEAHNLFNIHPDKIDIVVHPQSVIHSMVEYTDGSILAHMAASDMRIPVSYALSWPNRMLYGQRLKLTGLPALTFEEPDLKRFRAVSLAYEAQKTGLHACVILNAANELAVDAFLQRKLRFTDIVEMVEECLNSAETVSLTGLEEILRYDQYVRALAHSCIMKYNRQTRVA